MAAPAAAVVNAARLQSNCGGAPAAPKATAPVARSPRRTQHAFALPEDVQRPAAPRTRWALRAASRTRPPTSWRWRGPSCTKTTLPWGGASRRCARPCARRKRSAPRRRAPPPSCARRAGRAGRCSSSLMVERCVEIKIYGAFVLNQRVVLHAIDATPARWRGDAGSLPLDGASTAASSPRNDLVKNYRVHPTH